MTTAIPAKPTLVSNLAWWSPLLFPMMMAVVGNVFARLPSEPERLWPGILVFLLFGAHFCVACTNAERRQNRFLAPLILMGEMFISVTAAFIAMMMISGSYL